MSDLNDAFNGTADAGRECPGDDAECSEVAKAALPVALAGGWEVSAWSDKLDPAVAAMLTDETSSVFGESQDVEALRLLQRAPIRWDLLEEALGLDASPDSVTFEFSGDPDSPGITASVRLIPAPHRQQSVDDSAVPSERQLSFAPTIMPLAKAALVQPPRRVTDARIGAEGREAFDSYGGTD